MFYVRVRAPQQRLENPLWRRLRRHAQPRARPRRSTAQETTAASVIVTRFMGRTSAVRSSALRLPLRTGAGGPGKRPDRPANATREAKLVNYLNRCTCAPFYVSVY